MNKLASALALVVLTFSLACDSTEKKADGKADDKKSATKTDDKKGDDAKGATDVKTDDADAKAEPAKPVALADLSLEKVGIDATMKAPEGAVAAEDMGAYTVKAGESFQLEIHTGAADLAARKKEVQENTVNKLKAFVTESDKALVYESEVMGQAEFHFVANVDLDDAKYHCEDTKGKAYAKADVEAMLAACTSLKATE